MQDAQNEDTRLRGAVVDRMGHRLVPANALDDETIIYGLFVHFAAAITTARKVARFLERMNYIHRCRGRHSILPTQRKSTTGGFLGRCDQPVPF